VREALRILEVMGFAETHQGRGTFVKEPPATLDAPRLARLALQEVAIRDVYEARLGIEPFIASLAAERRTGAGLDRLDRTLADFRAAMAAADVDAMVLADLGFHRAIGTMTGNAILTQTLDAILDPAHHLSRITLRLPGRAPFSIAQHERVFAALRGGDAAGSRQAMVDHLTSAARALQEAAGSGDWSWPTPDGNDRGT
jgi:GntR family transcriptional repressor for pyruvate dehydrogenase complex